MGKPPTIEERVGILERSDQDCKLLQTERYNNMDKRLSVMEAWKDKLLLLAIVILLGVLGNLVFAVVGFLAKK
jgi:hypothetical protein